MCRQVLNVFTEGAAAARRGVDYSSVVNGVETASTTLPPERCLTEPEFELFEDKLEVPMIGELRACHDPPIDVAQMQLLHAPRPIRQRPALQLQLSVSVALGNAPAPSTV